VAPIPAVFLTLLIFDPHVSQFYDHLANQLVASIVSNPGEQELEM
jgi:hypothetical protein